MKKTMRRFSKDGDDEYVVKDEKFDKRRQARLDKEMNTAGIATELKKAKKNIKGAKIPKVKPQKKGY